VNTIAHVSAMLALFWLALYCYRTLGEPILGYVAIGAGLVMLVLSFFALNDDLYVLSGRTLWKGGKR